MNEILGKLEDKMVELEAWGWHVHEHGDMWTTMKKGKKVQNIPHLFMTIATSGIWAIVWVSILLIEHNKTLHLGPDGFLRQIAEFIGCGERIVLLEPDRAGQTIRVRRVEEA